jgi:hypothetical protein
MFTTYEHGFVHTLKPNEKPATGLIDAKIRTL